MISSVRSAGEPAVNVTDAKLDLLIEMFGNFLHRHRFACQNLKYDILDVKAALADTTIISDYTCKTQHHLDLRLTRVKYDGIHCGGTGDDSKESQTFAAKNSADTDEALSTVSVNIQDSCTIVSNKSDKIPNKRTLFNLTLLHLLVSQINRIQNMH